MRATLIIFLLFLVASQAQSSPPKHSHLEEFKRLTGAEQVELFFRDAFGGLIFFKQFTAWPFEMRFEQDILVSSPDQTINHALVLKSKNQSREQARYAIYLICQRAKFVAQSEFPIRRFIGTYGIYGSEGTRGNLNPFSEGFDRVGEEAGDAVRAAVNSNDSSIRDTARLYGGELKKEFAEMAADNLVTRWRTEMARLPGPYHYVDSSETGDTVRLLEDSLVAKGLAGANSVATLLEKESAPWAREHEISLIESFDYRSIRLRGSEEGRRVIAIVEKSLTSGPLKPYYMTEDERRQEQTRLQGQFFQDQVGCMPWTNSIAFSLQQLYGDPLTAPNRGGSNNCDPVKMATFISYLTDLDPTFPSWEFPSSGYQADMFHPKFKQKMARYHQAWVRMNSSH